MKILVEEMQDAIAKEVGEFHRKLGFCEHRKVIKGKIHCKKKNEIYNWNNFCIGCKFLPKIPKIASLKQYLNISMTDEIKNAIENLENYLCQAEQLNQVMQADTAKGINVAHTNYFSNAGRTFKKSKKWSKSGRIKDI